MFSVYCAIFLFFVRVDTFVRENWFLLHPMVSHCGMYKLWKWVLSRMSHSRRAVRTNSMYFAQFIVSAWCTLREYSHSQTVNHPQPKFGIEKLPCALRQQSACTSEQIRLISTEIIHWLHLILLHSFLLFCSLWNWNQTRHCHHRRRCHKKNARAQCAYSLLFRLSYSLSRNINWPSFLSAAYIRAARARLTFVNHGCIRGSLRRDSGIFKIKLPTPRSSAEPSPRNDIGSKTVRNSWHTKCISPIFKTCVPLLLNQGLLPKEEEFQFSYLYDGKFTARAILNNHIRNLLTYIVFLKARIFRTNLHTILNVTVCNCYCQLSYVDCRM